MKETKLSRMNVFTIGIFLFSMFFGSGNLIFPPFMGFEAGSKTWLAFIGFSFAAVVFPVLGVIAISENGNLYTLSSKVNKKFALIFTIIVFLALGPGLAIPRNAAVSFEMAVVPFVSSVSIWIRIAYSIAFFAVSYLLSIHPEKLADWLGKILGPILIALMIIIAAACFIKVPDITGAPAGSYADQQLVRGFMDGYNTMDTLAALNFGTIVALNIRNKGINDKKAIVHYTMKAGIIAGILMTVIYALLSMAGALSGSLFKEAANGAVVLTNIVFYLFGNKGVVLLGILYVLSCLTTCVGLLCSCSAYFAEISKIKYHTWIIIFSITGCLFSIVGLDQLLRISVPFLNFVYPPAMVLVILGLFHKRLGKYPQAFSWSVGLTAIASAVYTLNDLGITVPFLTSAIINLPPNTGLCWMLPALIGVLTGICREKRKPVTDYRLAMDEVDKR